MNGYVLDFDKIDRSSFPIVGGKGANLGKMTQAGFPVPSGFCVTTETYRTFIRQSKEMPEYFQRLARIRADELEDIAALGRKIREHMVTLPIPESIRSAIIEAWRRCGEDQAYAVRSSATAEDLEDASFAGQQDTYLNVRGEEHMLQAVRKCRARCCVKCLPI